MLPGFREIKLKLLVDAIRHSKIEVSRPILQRYSGALWHEARSANPKKDQLQKAKHLHPTHLFEI